MQNLSAALFKLEKNYTYAVPSVKRMDAQDLLSNLRDYLSFEEFCKALKFHNSEGSIECLRRIVIDSFDKKHPLAETVKTANGREFFVPKTELSRWEDYFTPSHNYISLSDLLGYTISNNLFITIGGVKFKESTLDLESKLKDALFSFGYITPEGPYIEERQKNLFLSLCVSSDSIPLLFQEKSEIFRSPEHAKRVLHRAQQLSGNPYTPFKELLFINSEGQVIPNIYIPSADDVEKCLQTVCFPFQQWSERRVSFEDVFGIKKKDIQTHDPLGWKKLELYEYDKWYNVKMFLKTLKDINSSAFCPPKGYMTVAQAASNLCLQEGHPAIRAIKEIVERLQENQSDVALYRQGKTWVHPEIVQELWSWTAKTIMNPTINNDSVSIASPQIYQKISEEIAKISSRSFSKAYHPDPYEALQGKIVEEILSDFKRGF